MSTADISIMGPCACGGSARSPNYECERCRLVYFVLLVQETRQAQDTYFRDRNSLNLDRARHLESKVDKLVTRFTTRPESTLFPDDGGTSTYYQYEG